MRHTSSHKPIRHRAPCTACFACAVVAAAGTSATAHAAVANADIVWRNVRDLPASLTIQADTWAWSAIRSEPPHFSSHRIAADDFILDAQTTITRITFFSVELQPPSIIGGDWYIYADDSNGEPGTLIAFEASATLTRSRIGATHPSFGDIYENVMEPANLVLPAGRYFLAFRTFQSMPLPVVGKPNNAALTERWTHGSRRAQWNFDIAADGTPTGPWVLMRDFNQVDDQEWAFIIEGETATCYPDCDQSTGVGVLDIFDFLCFQDAFVRGDPYACDCDTSPAIPVCDIFDFLCFQDAFVGGCP